MPHDIPESAYPGIHGVSDWFPGRVSRKFRDGYDKINWDKKSDSDKPASKEDQKCTKE